MIKKIIFFRQALLSKFISDWAIKKKPSFFFITLLSLKSPIKVKELLVFKYKNLIKNKKTLKELKKLCDLGAINLSSGIPFFFLKEVINSFRRKIFNLYSAFFPMMLNLVLSERVVFNL